MQWCLRALVLLWLSALEAVLGDNDDSKREVLVKEVVLDSPVADIVYLGRNHECLLVTTKTKRLYFSEDSGMSWVETTQKVETAPGAEVQVERVIVSPTDKSVVVLQTNRRIVGDTSGAAKLSTWHPYIYVSEDSGRTWRRAWGRHHGLHSWIAHPTERTWALVSWWSGNCDSKAKTSVTKEDAELPKDDEDADDVNSRKACVHRLMLTTDLGRNFLQLADYIVQFSWGSTTLGQANRVYYTAYHTRAGDQGKLSLWTREVDFWYLDVGPSGRPVDRPFESVTHGNKFLISNEFLLVAKVKDVAQQTVRLMVSRDGAKTWNAALLPSGMGELEEKWYTVLDTSEGAVILHINAETEGVKDTGNIFVSDAEGYKYSQSLAHNVRSSLGECEFDKVVSLQGVYLANTVVPPNELSVDAAAFAKEKAAAAEEVEAEAAGGSEVDRRHSRGGQSVPSKAGKEERTIRTVISLDKGGSWSYLKPPRVNSLGKPYDCAGKRPEDCSLHLHGTSSWDIYAPFYSSESSVGIIMGTGNVGPSLRFEPADTNTFLSRDGGLTWMEAHKGAFIYEFGDHGGLIVMADDLKKTSEVIFTWNEGQSWYDFKVSKTPFEVDNIITEPNLTATTFVMFGTREDGVGVLYFMRFDSLKFPTCKGVWAADSVSSDYESWTASDGVSSEQCILGEQVTYTRRKRTSQCWNGEKFERPVVHKRCSCTQADYACDIGFVRAVGSMECVFGGQDMMPTRFIPSICHKSFSASAYRKVPGDRCEGGWEPRLVEVPCPSTGLAAGAARGLLFVVAAVGLFCVAQSYAAGGGGAAGSGLAAALCGLLGQLLVRNRGFKGHEGVRYKRVEGDELDMDGIGAADESLNDFLDEADFDDRAPHVYSSADDRRFDDRREAEEEGRWQERSTLVSGGARAALEEVPKLQAPPPGALPPSGGAEHFDIGDTEDLL